MRPKLAIAQLAVACVFLVSSSFAHAQESAEQLLTECVAAQNAFRARALPSCTGRYTFRRETKRASDDAGLNSGSNVDESAGKFAFCPDRAMVGNDTFVTIVQPDSTIRLGRDSTEKKWVVQFLGPGLADPAQGEKVKEYLFGEVTVLLSVATGRDGVHVAQEILNDLETQPCQVSHSVDEAGHRLVAFDWSYTQSDGKTPGFGRVVFDRDHSWALRAHRLNTTPITDDGETDIDMQYKYFEESEYPICREYLFKTPAHRDTLIAECEFGDCDDSAFSLTQFGMEELTETSQPESNLWLWVALVVSSLIAVVAFWLKVRR